MPCGEANFISLLLLFIRACWYGSSPCSLPQDTSYREKPATPNSPSGTTVTTMYDHLLSPSSPEPDEKDDRLRNDLLDEICNDMGIDDSMDLDFDDFCYSNGQQKATSAAAAAGPSSRFTALTTPNKPVTSEAGQPTSSGYATSDSLCAIAKLTQSISSESRSETGESAEPVIKQEEAEIATGTNDTDQGKVAANRLLQQQQKEVSSPPAGSRSSPPSAPVSEKPREEGELSPEQMVTSACAVASEAGAAPTTWQQPATGFTPSTQPEPTR